LSSALIRPIIALLSSDVIERIMSHVTLVKKLSEQEVEEFPEKLDTLERLEGVKNVEDLRRRIRFRLLLSIISRL
jgi:hypothetical protein